MRFLTSILFGLLCAAFCRAEDFLPTATDYLPSTGVSNASCDCALSGVCTCPAGQCGCAGCPAKSQANRLPPSSPPAQQPRIVRYYQPTHQPMMTASNCVGGR